MALTRKFLSALGIEADKIDEIISAHTETVDGLKEQLKQAKEAADKLPKVQEQLDSLKDAAKNSGDAAKIQKEFDEYKEAVEKEKTLTAKKAVLSKIAKDAGLSEAGIAKVLKYTDYASLELDDKGEEKDSKALLKSLKEEWPEYIKTTNTAGANTANPPASTGNAYKSKDEIFAIKDDGERQRAIAENHELFGF
jgi:hypothetical protein